MVTRFLPEWIKNYRREDLKPDLAAGLTVGVMLIPQGMAYAMLAGLPPIYGLYASCIPLIIYAVLGTSRHLSVGPVAIDSMLTAAAIGLLAQAGTSTYISLAILLALLVGLIQFSLGLARMGFLVKFLSYPVVQGFTSAAAIVIGISQLKHLLGIDVVSSPYMQDMVPSLALGIVAVHWLTFAIGLGAIAMLILFKEKFRGLPGPLIVMISTTLMVGLLRLDEYGIQTIGFVPSGLPTPGIPNVNFNQIRSLLPAAFAIALIGFMESLAVARALQAKHPTYKINTNKELLSIGLANMVGSIFRSFPVSGGFSRSAVNEQAGARSGMASIVSAILVIATLLFLTPLFTYLPNVVLASIILVAITRLIHLKSAKYLWRVDRKDFLMMLVTFMGTLFLGIGTGIVIGVALSLARIIFEASYPHYAELGRVPGTNAFRNVRRFEELEIDDDILIFRFDAPLFFANADRFRELLLEFISTRDTKLKAIIVDMESTNNIDTSAIHVFEEVYEEVTREKILLLLAEVKGPVRDKFYRSGFSKVIGDDHFFLTVDDALRHIGDVLPLRSSRAS